MPFYSTKKEGSVIGVFVWGPGGLGYLSFARLCGGGYLGLEVSGVVGVLEVHRTFAGS